MKVVMPGGTGHVGQAIRRHLEPLGWQFVVLTRSPNKPGEVRWDGMTQGPWAKEIDGADVVINLAGRSVNCRYTKANLREMMDSRVNSVRAVGEAIANAKNPPRLWLQASTATIYAHRFDAPNDEATGIIGGDEPSAPYKWTASIDIAKAWEEELFKAQTPRTRKIAMRSAMTMSVDRGCVFDVLATLARRGLGGQAGNGRQYVSWIHELDFVRSLQFLMDHEDMDGPVNICSPNPLPNAQFMRVLREFAGARLALPTPAWILEIGALFMRTETELILKSRRVVPKRLLDAGFDFRFPEWPEAAADLSRRWQRVDR
ncbi:MAG: TIGR01777 family oxidoreductase [Fimbriimonadales bacterium]